MKPIAIDNIKVMNLGLGRSIYSPIQLEEFAGFQESQGTRRAFLAESAERAYNTRVGGQWGSGLSDLATAHLIDAVGYHLVPMYRLIGPTAAIALLVLFLVGILRMLLDIVVRSIAIAKVRGCGWWLMGAFWGTLFQIAVAPVQWAMAKGHNIGKTVSYQMTAEAARLEIEDNEAQRLTDREMEEASAPQGADQQPGQAGDLVQRVPGKEGQREGLPSPHRQRRAGHQGQLHYGGHERG